MTSDTSGAKVRVGINGLGRIGRAFLRNSLTRDDIEVVAANDLTPHETLAYLIKYDTAYGTLAEEVRTEGEDLVVAGKRIRVFGEKEPAKIPWAEARVDVVIESTGVFTEASQAIEHTKGGARRVVISAPEKEGGMECPTVLMGVNQEALATCQVSSNASCTTNAASPVIAILDEALGIERAILSTAHAYTATQSLVDGPKKDLREGRAAAMNIIPTATGAAKAVAHAYPALAGKFDGIALRVPVVAGSIADITFVARRATTAEEVNDILRRAAETDRWRGIFGATDEELVSSDIVGDPRASIADLAMTRVVDGTLVKVLAWYDNEAGYTETLVRHALLAGRA